MYYDDYFHFWTFFLMKKPKLRHPNWQLCDTSVFFAEDVVEDVWLTRPEI